MVNGAAGVPIVHAVDHVVVAGEQGIVCVTILHQAVVVEDVLVPIYIGKFVRPSLAEEVRSLLFFLFFFFSIFIFSFMKVF